MGSRVGVPKEGDGKLVKLFLVLEPLLEILVNYDGIVPELEEGATLLDSDLGREGYPGLRRSPRMMKWTTQSNQGVESVCM